MRRAFIVLPVAVYTSACSFVPFTPSTPVRYDAQTVSAGPSVVVPARPEAMSYWQLPPSNPWAPYEKLTLLSSLDTVPRAAALPNVLALPIVADAQNAAMAVSAAGLPNDTAWFVDLRGAASVVFAAALSHRAGESVSAVLTFNNWPAENELVPAEETLAALLRFAPLLPRPSEVSTRPVFLLDAWRLAYRDIVPDDDDVDNRYILNPTDLPDAEALRAHGIRRVIYVVEDLNETDVEEFFRSVPEFERMLVRSGTILIKYWFSITDEEQHLRFQMRIHDPLKQWKLSPMDLESRSRWELYTKAKEDMLERTHILEAPWWIIEADDKKSARLNCINHLLGQIDYREVPHDPVMLPARIRNADYSREPIPESMHVPKKY